MHELDPIWSVHECFSFLVALELQARRGPDLFDLIIELKCSRNLAKWTRLLWLWHWCAVRWPVSRPRARAALTVGWPEWWSEWCPTHWPICTTDRFRRSKEWSKRSIALKTGSKVFQISTVLSQEIGNQYKDSSKTVSISWLKQLIYPKSVSKEWNEWSKQQRGVNSGPGSVSDHACYFSITYLIFRNNYFIFNFKIRGTELLRDYGVVQ